MGESDGRRRESTQLYDVMLGRKRKPIAHGRSRGGKRLWKPRKKLEGRFMFNNWLF